MAFAMSAVVTGFNGPSCLPKNDPILATMEDKDEEEYPNKTLDQRRHVTIIAAPSSPSVSSASSEALDEHDDCQDTSEKIIIPSEIPYSDEYLIPCGVCGRTFSRSALERHMKICQKVNQTKRRIFEASKLRTKYLDSVPITPVQRRKSTKSEESRPCPHCSRKFGPKPYDRHVEFCAEKARRLQDSPNKDLVALAKLHARTAYRPKTPNARKTSGSPSRLGSQERDFYSACNTPTQSLWQSFRAENAPMSLSRSEYSSKPAISLPKQEPALSSQQGHPQQLQASLKRARSLSSKSSDISFQHSTDHTKETEDTKFVRAATGRGSIKRGPAPTKASLLRLQTKVVSKEKDTEEVRNNGLQPHYQYHQAGTPVRGVSISPVNPRKNGSLLVKPYVVRPSSMSSSSLGYRREPEGIEQQSMMNHRDVGVGLVGSYDHSQEYDPYQSAARQMQELLFGTTASHPPAAAENHQPSAGAPDEHLLVAASSSDPDLLKPSMNSAFQKYVPGGDIPSTADINSRINGGLLSTTSSKTRGAPHSGAKAKLEAFLTFPRQQQQQHRVLANSTAWESSNHHGSGSSGVLSRGTRAPGRFCHQCGSAFALSTIRFCCECGVKRLGHS